ncbi:hypothetical protein MCUN1_002012 [Malassezia cuniculi]|uniref:Uncharacterized protein n=1 Tax=Malassezia cuniculi TaxID=948313 RepID=A0AAF0EV18_9BASI|nr:hypothetical protein MCUN1_002012 [Malassezia cuniculi]
MSGAGDLTAGDTAAALQSGLFVSHSVSTVYEDELGEQSRDTAAAFAGSSSGTGRTDNDNMSETLAVEENLRRWSENERMRRRSSRMRRSIRHDAPPSAGGAGGLVRKLSSISISSQQQDPADSPIEMVPSSGFMRTSKYNRVSDSTDNSLSPNAGTPQLPTIESGMFRRDESFGDLASPSFDDIANAGTYRALNKGKGRAVYAQPQNTSDVDLSSQHSARRKPFPLVTAGGQSSRQYRQSHMQLPPQSVAADPSATSYVSSPFDDGERLTSANSMSTMNKILPDTSMQDVRLYAQSSSTLNVLSRENEDRPSWYWSDLLCGCGMFSSVDDEDEQAGRTNPME